MAELRRQRLELALEPAELAAALDDDPGWNTTDLVCLSGDWLDGGALVACGASRHVVGDWPELGNLGEGRADAEHPAVDPVGPVDPVDPVGPVNLVDPVGPSGRWLGWAAYDRADSRWGLFSTWLRRDGDGRWSAETVDPTVELSDLAARVTAMRPAAAARPPSLRGLRGTDERTHLTAVEEAIAAIRAGELFQVNVAARWQADFAGAALDLFRLGVTRLHPGWAAFVRLGPPIGARTAVSFSPELFLRRSGRRVLSAPIKGTRRRAADSVDRQDPAAVALRASIKDRAENVMIVDLVRNDLGRVCEPGTVQPRELLQVRPAPGVWHLVSEVCGTLREGIPTAELLAATFPPGSVTGAPKIRAQQLIEEFEDVPRSVFTGAIGWLADAIDGDGELNVAIRTFELQADPLGLGVDRLGLGVGGGITADSVPILEWQECLIKAAPLFELFADIEPSGPANGSGPDAPPDVDPEVGIVETMLATDGRVHALADHLSRLDTSARELFGTGLPSDLAAQVRLTAAGRGGRWRVRVTARAASTEVAIVAAGPAPHRIQLITSARGAGCWRHKWADRRLYDRLEAELAGTQRLEAELAEVALPASLTLPLFQREPTGPPHTQQPQIQETSRSAIVVLDQHATVLAPPLSDAILPSVTRRRFLDAARDRGRRIEIREIDRRELLAGRLVLSLSAIAGVVAVDRLDDIQLDVDLDLLDVVEKWLG
ncbi:MAG: aminodeoxychorismate synthase [Frankiales bacterium]|nr:aminodeoxychorismate synthase [Frankiales bacterium]